MSKKIVFYALMSTLSLVGCCQEHKVDNNHKKQCQPPVEQKQDKNDDDDGLNWYTNPANPIGLFSSMNMMND